MRRELHDAAVADGGDSTRVLSLLRPEPISGISAWSGRMAKTRVWRGRWTNIIVNTQPSSDGRLSGDHEHRAADTAASKHVAWQHDANHAEQVLAVAKVIAECAPCVVVGNDVAHAYIAGALVRHRGVRTLGVAHTAHEANADFFERCGPLADRWVVVSRGAGDRFGRWLAAGVEELTIMPCGVDVGMTSVRASVAPLTYPASPPPLRLLYAGRLDKHCKRVLDLATLADELHAHGVMFTLTIAGDGSARDELRTALSRHIDDGHVVMLGRVSLDDMSRLYASHDVFVLTSAFEGSPVSVAEAIAHGCIVAITAGCGGATDAVTDGVEGLIVDIGDMHEMARRIARLAGDAVAISRMSTAARSLARRAFDIERHAGDYEMIVATCAAMPVGYSACDAASLSDTWTRIRRLMALLGPCEPSHLRRIAQWWLADMGANACLADALAMDIPRVVGYAERTLIDAIARIATAGYRRLALFGAGQHTRRLEGVIEDATQIVAILDDRAGEPGGPPATIGRCPVIKPALARGLGVDAVIVSSDEHEESLADRAREALPGLPVTTLYVRTEPQQSSVAA